MKERQPNGQVGDGNANAPQREPGSPDQLDGVELPGIDGPGASEVNKDLPPLEKSSGANDSSSRSKENEPYVGRRRLKASGTDDSARDGSSKTTILPVVFYVFACFAMELLFVPVFSNMASGRGGPGFLVFLTGCLLGQIGFAVVIAGFATIRWVSGFLLATLLSVVAFCLFGVGQLFDQYQMMFTVDLLWSLPLIPVLLLVSGLPFAAARFFGGWYLTRRSEDLPRLNYGINDFFVITAVVGALLYLAGIPKTVWQLPALYYWPYVGGISLSIALFSSLAVFPGALVALRIRDPATSFLWQIGFSFIISIVIVIALSLASGGVAVDYSYPLAIVIGACLTFFAGMMSLRTSGFRLAGVLPRAQTGGEGSGDQVTTVHHDASPWSSEEDEAQTSPLGFFESPQGARICAAGIFVFAIVGVISVYFLDSYRMQRTADLNSLAMPLQRTGGDLWVDDYEVTAAKLGTEADDAMLKNFLASHPQLSNLDLSYSQITDESVDQILGYPNLIELDVSHTNLSAKAVSRLFPQLYSLKMAGLKVAPDELAKILKKDLKLGTLNELDISSMGLQFANLKEFWDVLPNQIAIRDCNLTDDQLEDLLEIREPWSLDVAGNRLDGSFLSAIGSVQTLDLSGNPITDAELQKVATKGLTTVRRLSLANNKLTDNSMPALAALGISELRLGDGSYSEDALSGSMLGLSLLYLASENYTGACFEKFNPGCYSLKLSHSGVTAQTVKFIADLDCGNLDFSHTDLGDDALPELKKVSWPYQVDLSHTKVTAQGLCRGDLSSFQEVILAWGQFTNEELKRIRRVINVRLRGGYDSDW